MESFLPGAGKAGAAASEPQTIVESVSSGRERMDRWRTRLDLETLEVNKISITFHIVSGCHGVQCPNSLFAIVPKSRPAIKELTENSDSQALLQYADLVSANAKFSAKGEALKVKAGTSGVLGAGCWVLSPDCCHRNAEKCPAMGVFSLAHLPWCPSLFSGSTGGCPHLAEWPAPFPTGR